MKDLSKMLGKDSEMKGKMSEQEIQAKLDVIKELMDEMMAAMGGSVKSGMDEMKKVTVAAPDKESLLKGLDAAQEIVPEISEEPSEEEAKMDSGEKPMMQEDEEDMSDLYSLMQKKKKKMLG